MKGLDAKRYVHTSRKRFDPISIVFSVIGLGIVVSSVVSVDKLDQIFDMRSILIVCIGTFASLLFQFDISTILKTVIVIMKSLVGSPEKKILATMKKLDDAILKDISLTELSEGDEITGELIDDIVYMYNKGLIYEEIDEFVTSRISEEFLTKRTSVNLLNRAALIAPAFGLFGTVMGLIGVLKSLADPSNIGPSMSLALMTTAYGAGLGSLIFTPLAGRIEHHNEIFLEFHKQLLSKISILLNREERKLDRVNRVDGISA